MAAIAQPKTPPSPPGMTAEEEQAERRGYKERLQSRSKPALMAEVYRNRWRLEMAEREAAKQQVSVNVWEEPEWAVVATLSPAGSAPRTSPPSSPEVPWEKAGGQRLEPPSYKRQMKKEKKKGKEQERRTAKGKGKHPKGNEFKDCSSSWGSEAWFEGWQK